MATTHEAGTVQTRREGWAWIAAIGATGVGFISLTILLARFAPHASGEPWLTIWLELAVLGTVGALLVLWLFFGRSALASTMAVAVVSLFLAFIVMVTLRATPYTLDGLSGDQGLYSAYVTKFATYRGNVDAIYAKLPAFYPPFYFALLGRLAQWLQIEPFKMLKVGLLATTILLPFLLSWSWRRLVALPYAATTAFTLLLEQQWYKPAEWLTMVLFVPWWLHWVENCTDRPLVGWAARLRWWIVGGLIGALLFQGYYYWFFIGALSLLLQLVRQLLQPATRPRAALLMRNAIPMLASTALFSANYWGPYLYSMAHSGGWQVLQNRWVAQGKLLLPMPFADATAGAVILFGGLLYLSWMAPQQRVMRSLLYFLVAIYSWLAVGYLGLLVDTPLVSFRAYPMATYIPALGMAFGIAHLWQERGRLAATLAKERTFDRPIAMVALVLCFLFAQVTVVTWLKNEDVPKAVAKRYPTTTLAALDAAVGGDYANKTILFSRDYADWIAYRPFFAFLAWSAHYSHPAAHFYARLDLLQRLTMVHSPDLFAAALFRNRYDQIDHLLLKAVDGGWQMTFLDDNFPNRNVERTLTFAADNLRAPYFALTPVTVDAPLWGSGELALWTPVYDQVPLDTALSGVLTTASKTDIALAYALATGFGRHLALFDVEGLRTQANAQLLNDNLSALSLPVLADLYQFSDEPLRSAAYKALATVMTAPIDLPLTDQNGAPKLQVIGYTLQNRSEGGPPLLSLYVAVLAPLDWDYSVWLHAFRDGEKMTLDFPPLQPSTSWLPGQVVQLQRPLDLTPGTYRLEVGFWRSAEDVRLVAPTGEIGLTLDRVVVP